MNPSAQTETPLKIGSLVVDWQRHIISLANQTLELSPIEFEIIAYLAQRSPRTISPQRIMEQLYGYEADSREASAVIRTNIYRIRQKMATISDEDIIRTVRGVGYAIEPPQKPKEDVGLIDGRYRILKRLGQGATANVYLGYQAALERNVAIKILRPALIEDDTFRERFRQEARHVASLQHPNIIQVYDFGETADNYYLIMAYLEGQTLQEKLNQLQDEDERMPLPEALRIIREIGQAIAYAHQQGMIHRDIKPENVMLTTDGRVILMDFGLAKLVSAPHLTVEGKISGTPNYMAPEQIQGLPIDMGVDIYAMGVLMYRLITGRLPFIADTELGVLFLHLRDAPPLPTLFAPDLTKATELTILKALAKDPGRRYQSMEALLADLDNPDKITTTIEEVMPILKVAESRPHYLPAPLTPFIQRTKEVNAIQVQLLQRGVRLLTLLGFGGVGKTRLALEVGKNLLPSFSDGVFFIDLTTVQTTNLLPSTIAHTIGLVESGSESVKSQLLAHLSSRHILLVLDNFEHVLEAAPLVNEILSAAPNCKVLATSREPLRLYGEHLFKISPLPLPDLSQRPSFDELKDFTAVRLFASRAQAANPDFVLGPENGTQVAELCIQLDGLPLALELAAGQMYLYSLSEITAQLSARLALLTGGPRDHAARQQTMRGAIDWSYSLLSTAEQQAFIRLGVFYGRFSAEAAAEIVGDVDLTELARKSLLQQEVGDDGQSSFWMLQVLWEYAVERLEGMEEGHDLQRKHTAFYLKLAETAEGHLTGSEPTPWFEQLEEAHDNFRAILHRSLKTEQQELALQLGSVLWRLWAVNSHLSEGRLWLQEILAVTADSKNKYRANATYGAGRLALFEEKMTLAADLFEESLLIFRHLQDQPGQATILNSLGEIALEHNDNDRAASLFEEALALFQNEDNLPGIVQSLTNLGHLASNQEDYDRANTLLLQSLALEEKMDRPEATAIVLNGLGEVARNQARFSEATAYYEKALGIYRKLNYKIGQAVMLHNLGQVFIEQQDFQQAVFVFRESLKLLRSMDEKMFVAWNLAGLGCAMMKSGNTEQGVRLFSITKRLLEEHGGRLDMFDQAVFDQCLVESKKRLTETEWQQAWLEGQSMPIEAELLDIITLTPILPLE